MMQLAGTPGRAPDGAPPAIRDTDRDALHILPLSIVPVDTLALRRARLIKNAHLHSVIEVFEDLNTGSGQLEIEDLAKEFGWPGAPPHPDLVLLRKLGQLPSYDVYSLRILLRREGIAVNDHDALRLSEAKVRELTEYMTAFTRPLIMQIYGSDNVAIQSFEDVIALFRETDVKKARDNLKVMADKLHITLGDVPLFLEDYGDIFLSLSYFRNCLDQIEPIIGQFLEALDDLRSNYQLRGDQNLMKTCNMMQSTIDELMATITGRFENFDRSTNDMWNEISAERFRTVEELIRSYHTTIGGVLCALSVKMDAWARIFPNRGTGGLVKRSEFIMSDMRYGIESIQKIEDQAPMLAGLDG